MKMEEAGFQLGAHEELQPADSPTPSLASLCVTEEAVVFSRSADHMVDNPQPRSGFPGMMSALSTQSNQQKEATEAEPCPGGQGKVPPAINTDRAAQEKAERIKKQEICCCCRNVSGKFGKLPNRYSSQREISGCVSRAWRMLSRAYAISNFTTRRARFLELAALPAQAIECISKHAHRKGFRRALH